jgi:hypothetical protein
MSSITVHGGDIRLYTSFEEAWRFLNGKGEIYLETSTGSTFTAKATVTQSGDHRGEKTIRFFNGKIEYARSYPCCWGHYYNCNRTRHGMYCKSLDDHVKSRR